MTTQAETSNDRLAGVHRGKFAGRFRSNQAGGNGGAKVSAEAVAGGPYLMVNTDHQGAASSPMRGYIYWRSTDTRRQINDFTDDEIRRRLDFLFHHSAVCRRLVLGMAKLCGVVTPQPNTVDAEWNDLAFEDFQTGACSPEISDAGGRFDFYLGQIATNTNRFLAGRSVGVLTETQAKKPRAQIAYYDPWQLDHRPGRGQPPRDPKRFMRGVEINKFGRHLAYFLRDAENPEGRPLRVPAKDALYFGKFDNHGQVHPLSILAGAIVNMIDVAETRASWKSQLKSAGRRGEVIEKDAAAVNVMGGMGGQPVRVKVDQGDGTEKEIDLEMMYGGGPEIQKLAAGERLRLVTDDRPSANNQAFDRTLVNDCALFADLPPAALFEISGTRTGPHIRYDMAEIDRWIRIQHLWMSRNAHRFFSYSTAKSIKHGRLRKPRDKQGRPVHWWRHDQILYLGMPSLTIDLGQRGKISVSNLDAGFTNWSKEWGEGGLFWKKGITQRITEVAFAKLKIWEASNELAEQTNGEVDLSAAEVFKFASFGGSGAASFAASAGDMESRLAQLEQGGDQADDDEPNSGDQAGNENEQREAA